MKAAVFSILLCLMLPNAARAQPKSIQSIIDSEHQTVVKLFGAGVGNLDSYGSGVLISQEGHVATVWNHLVNTGFLTAVVADGRRYTVEVVGTSLEHDLAILKLEAESDATFPFVDWKTAHPVLPGESVLAFSNVYHVATGNEPVSVMHGVIAAEIPLDAGLGRWQFPVKSPVLMIDAITNNSGAAGGHVTTSDGTPLGLLGREIRHRGTNMWVNYAVPWKTLSPAIREILAGRRVRKTNDADQTKKLSYRELTSRFGLTVFPSVIAKTPAYIDRITPNSASATAGLQRGDLILLCNDRVIQSTDEFRTEMATFRRGQTVSLTVSRNNQIKVCRVKVP